MATLQPTLDQLEEELRQRDEHIASLQRTAGYYGGPHQPQYYQPPPYGSFRPPMGPRQHYPYPTPYSYYPSQHHYGLDTPLSPPQRFASYVDPRLGQASAAAYSRPISGEYIQKVDFARRERPVEHVGPPVSEAGLESLAAVVNGEAAETGLKDEHSKEEQRADAGEPESTTNPESMQAKTVPDKEVSADKTTKANGEESATHESKSEGEKAAKPTDAADKSTEDAPPKDASRIHHVRKQFDASKSQWEEVDVDVTAEDSKDGDAPKSLVTFRRVMDVSNSKDVSTVEFVVQRSMYQFLATFDEWWRDSEYKSKDEIGPITLAPPFYPFIWKWDEYVAQSEPRDTDSADEKLKRGLLHQMVQIVRNSGELEPYFRARDSIITTKKISYDFLWTIFPHGSIVCTKSFMNQMQLFQVMSTSAPPLKSSKRFRISCAAFDWNGTQFVVYNYDMYIKEFSKEKPISSLPVFPEKYYKEGTNDDSTLRQTLMERGKRFCELCTASSTGYQCEYQGTALVNTNGPNKLLPGRPSDDDTFSDGFEIEVAPIQITGKQGGLIVDSYWFMNSNTNETPCEGLPPLGKRIPDVDLDCGVCYICKSSSLMSWNPEDDQTEVGEAFAKSKDRLLFLPPRVLGYALNQKEWGQFLVTNTKSSSGTEEDLKPFYQELQLATSAKDLLMALVKHHASDVVSDVIEDKGKCLAILLHGPPGVGKTLTAETIALATNRPLLTIAVAEIGVNPVDAEERLQDIFKDAARWRAVLLVDEADVFVEERRQGDLERNAMVSVLLRCLEYYDGIIILTTNRVRSIDAAVQSRINMAVQYRDLTPEQRLQIYKNRLRIIPSNEIENREKFDEDLESSSIVRKANKANGRQVRNTVNGARALAKSQGVKLNVKHLEAVDENTASFIESMADLLQKQRHRNEVD